MNLFSNMHHFTDFPKRQFNRGFTLIELIIVLAIAAVLASVAMPSFQEAVFNAKRYTLVSELIGSLQRARSEAIRRSGRVSVCARQSNTSCGDDWSNGWLVFTDSGATIGSIDADETILSVAQEQPSTYSVISLAKESTGTGAPAAWPYIRFTSRGATNWRGSGTFVICDSRGDTSARALNVTFSGDVRPARKNNKGVFVDAFGNTVTCPQ